MFMGFFLNFFDSKHKLCNAWKHFFKTLGNHGKFSLLFLTIYKAIYKPFIKYFVEWLKVKYIKVEWVFEFSVMYNNSVFV